MIFMIIEYFYKWEAYVKKFINNTFGFLKEVENYNLLGWFLNPTLHLLTFFYFLDYEEIEKLQLTKSQIKLFIHNAYPAILF